MMGVYDYKFEYQLLDRLRADCKFFLGNGNHHSKYLWAQSVKAQIAKMRELYDMLPEKPEWLTKEQIDTFEQKMLAVKEILPSPNDLCAAKLYNA